MRNALVAGHAYFRVDPLGSLDAQIHGVKTMLNARLAMRDGKGKLLAKSQHPVSGIWYPSPAATPHRGDPFATAREKFSPCRDPSLPCPAGTLQHRHICQARMDSPRRAAFREREFRRDDRPWRHRGSATQVWGWALAAPLLVLVWWDWVRLD